MVSRSGGAAREPKFAPDIHFRVDTHFDDGDQMGNTRPAVAQDLEPRDDDVGCMPSPYPASTKGMPTLARRRSSTTLTADRARQAAW